MNRLAISGIPIRFHWSFLILIAIILLPVPSIAELPFKLYLSALIPSMVLFHELGHSWMAQHLGFSVKKIVLFGLGGMAFIDMSKSTARQEMLVSFAGPLVNLLLFGIGFLLHTFLYGLNVVLPDNNYLIAFWLANFFMGAFNLIPAFPMDGGRMMRAGLSKVFGRVTSIRIVTNVSFVLAGLGAIAAVWFIEPLLFAVALFIVVTAYSERRTVTG